MTVRVHSQRWERSKGVHFGECAGAESTAAGVAAACDVRMVR